MKKVIAPLLFVIASCGSLEPDYFELGGEVGQGAINHDRHGGYDTTSESLAFAFGWNLGQQSKAMKNLADLDVSKAGELSLRDNSRDSSIIINNDKEKSLIEESEGIHEQLAPTKNKEEGLAFLMWSGGILILAFGAMSLSKAGFKIPFFENKKD